MSPCLSRSAEEAALARRDQSGLGCGLVLLGSLGFIGLFFFSWLLFKDMSRAAYENLLWTGGIANVLMVIIGTVLIAASQPKGSSAASSVMGAMLTAMMVMVMVVAFVIAGMISLVESCFQALQPPGP